MRRITSISDLTAIALLAASLIGELFQVETSITLPPVRSPTGEVLMHEHDFRPAFRFRNVSYRTKPSPVACMRWPVLPSWVNERTRLPGFDSPGFFQQGYITFGAPKTY